MDIVRVRHFVFPPQKLHIGHRVLASDHEHPNIVRIFDRQIERFLRSFQKNQTARNDRQFTRLEDVSSFSTIITKH
jgi:hypothetical protein